MRKVCGLGWQLSSCLCALLIGSLLGPTPVLRAEPRFPGLTLLETEALQLRAGGTAQARGAYAQQRQPKEDRSGVGVRRVRGLLWASLFERGSLFLQLSGDDGAALTFLDAAVSLHPHRKLRLRIGRFIAAQPAAFGFTIHQEVDGLDRAIVAREWAARTIGADGRDFAAELRWTPVPSIELRLAAHNGDGNWNRDRGNFRDEVGVESEIADAPFLAAGSAYAAWLPSKAWSIGAYLSYNAARSPTTARDGQGRRYTAYATHAYYGVRPGSQRWRAKFDLIGMHFERSLRTDGQRLDEHFLGASALLAHLPWRALECFTRIEWIDTALGSRPGPRRTFASAGAHLSSSALRGLNFAQERLTLDYTTRFDAGEGLAEHQVALQAQLAF